MLCGPQPQVAQLLGGPSFSEATVYGVLGSRLAVYSLKMQHLSVLRV
jgi:hypothetical protein